MNIAPHRASAETVLTNAVHRYRKSTDGEGRLTAAADPTAASREVLATVPATRIPYPWVSQTRPGWRLVVAAHGALTRHGLAALIVGQDGTARGHLPHTGGFISLSARRHPDFGRVGGWPVRCQRPEGCLPRPRAAGVGGLLRDDALRRTASRLIPPRQATAKNIGCIVPDERCRCCRPSGCQLGGGTQPRRARRRTWGSGTCARAVRAGRHPPSHIGWRGCAESAAR